MSHPVVQAKLRIGAPHDRYEQEAERVAAQVIRMPVPGTEYQPGPGAAAARGLKTGGERAPVDVTCHVPEGSKLMRFDRDDREDEERRRRGGTRWRTTPDAGQRRYRDWDRDIERWRNGGNPAPTDRADTEARLQQDVQDLRPRIPEWNDTMGMATFDSSFYGDPGTFDFRGRTMAGWEVNYYFISMALAHQGWDWNETQGIIWTWNASQEIGVNPFGGGGEMTDEMWFAAHEGFTDEQVRMAVDAVSPATTPYGPPRAYSPP